MEETINKTNIVNFNLDIYEGPLDVLLHLARTNEIEIADISLNTLIEQYLKFIESLQKLEINIASDYLEMAAELLKIKSASLIGQQSLQEDLIEELESLGYDRDQLLAKLLEYQKYKNVAEVFSQLVTKKSNSFYKDPDSMREFRDENFNNHLSLAELYAYYQVEMKKYYLHQENKEQEIEIQELEVEEKIKYFRELKKELTLKEVIDEKIISEKLAFFLGLLEAVKLQYVNVLAKENDVLIVPVGEKNE